MSIVSQKLPSPMFAVDPSSLNAHEVQRYVDAAKAIGIGSIFGSRVSQPIDDQIDAGAYEGPVSVIELEAAQLAFKHVSHRVSELSEQIKELQRQLALLGDERRKREAELDNILRNAKKHGFVSSPK